MLEIVRDRAMELRRRADQAAPAFSTRAIVDVCFPDALVTGRKLPDGIHEMVTITERGPLIVYQRNLPTADQRVAIAHAIGHLVFDVEDGRLSAPVNDERVEARADAFAAELLAPLADLAPFVDMFPDAEQSLDGEMYLDQVDEIASRFNVPVWLVDKQIRRLPR